MTAGMSFTRLTVALSAAAALALVVIGPASATPRAAAKYGGTLVVGLAGGDPGTLDPTVSASGSAATIYPSFCQSLYERDAQFRLIPVLAAAVPVISKDELSYTIALRRGVEFNDGTPFDAQAVVITLQRMLTLPGSTRANDYGSVDSVTASGPYTVTIRLRSRFTPLPDALATADGVIMSPTQLAKLGDSFGTNPVCVGPFMFDHRVVGDNVTLIKSPYYYDQKDVYLDKIVYKPMSDAAAAAAALKAGDIQVLDSVSAAEQPGVEQASGLRVLSAYKPGWMGLLVNIGNRNGTGDLPYTNLGTPLASSAKLRQAFEEAIDRNALARVVFGGLTQVSCNPIAPSNTAWFAATKVPCTPYDPQDAKRLVSASGFPNATVHLLTRSDRLVLAQFIQAQEAAIGINVVIDSFDPQTVLARAGSGSFDVCLMAWSPAGGDPDTVISPFLATSGQRNYGGYSNPRLDLILANGVKATSTKARSTLYHLAQQIIASDRPLIILDASITFPAFSTNLTGIRLVAGGSLRIENAQFKG
jgi:peptide/nickel transport system substrate-binding protein